jgi:monovalent cation:H+ antiporter-2, CPA2 family
VKNLKDATKTIIQKTKSKVFSAYQWTKRQRAQTLAAALVFFSTVLSMNHNVSSGQSAIASPSGTVAQRVMGRNVADHQLSIHNLHSRGGSSISASTPSKAIKSFLLQRGGGKKVESKSEVDIVTEATTRTFKDALVGLGEFMKGPKSDTLILLLATSLITPLCKMGGLSPIIGFLAAGMALGPNALGLISGIHTTETLAELGIVFFLFEMGIELSVERLMSMKKDVFGLGLSQFLTTACAIAAVGSFFNVPANALVVLGGGLALSSSAFVLQLLKDNNQLATRFGKASFGVLLFQDLAVVPLLVVTPILAGGGQGLASALGSATVKAGMALSSITFVGRVLLNPMFKLVAQANSQEAFLGVVLLTVLSMSFLTEGLGLSNTLGAFLAGVLLSETKYRYQIEADIAPFRGILLGLFFVTVGFEIDLGLIARNLPLIGSIVTLILLIKTAVLAILCKLFGLSTATSLQTGLILSQGGEFAFVAFGLARNLGILDPYMTKVLLTSVALTMALTPLLAQLGEKVAKKLEEDSDVHHYLGQDSDANEIRESNDFVVVVGYGIVGKLVCDLLDKKLYKYVGLEINPNKAIEARNKGLPVFYGDIGRPEVADAFGVEKAKAIIVTISDKNEANRAVIALRRKYPEKKIFARAVNADHAERLQRTLDVIAMVPIVPEDNVILSLPFGGAVLRSLGAAPEEVTAILESKRKEVLSGRKLAAEESLLELAQLGISPPSKEKDTKVADTKKAIDGEIVEEKKSPMVAEMIESISSSGADDESDDDNDNANNDQQ